MSASPAASVRSWAGLSLDRPLVMGILNLTPDSFSDGGRFASAEAAIAAAHAMVAAGADLIDLGGESTRPGADPVPPEVELARVMPVLVPLARAGLRVSIDTTHAATMRAALDAGAAVVNDVSALADPAALALVAERGAPVVLMHTRGTPRTMGDHAVYGDVVAEVAAELDAAVARAVAGGVRAAAICLDPGFGFAKRAEHSLALLLGLERVVALGWPVLVGLSRKGFIGRYAGMAVAAERDLASAVAGLFALDRGAAILRVHDVAGTVAALRMRAALQVRPPPFTIPSCDLIWSPMKNPERP